MLFYSSLIEEDWALECACVPEDIAKMRKVKPAIPYAAFLDEMFLFSIDSLPYTKTM